MPKVIDHAERAEAIAEAALRLLADGGLTGLSVRRVAEEAGLAVASLRRSFPTQASLRVYCMELIAQRVQRRTAAIDQGLPLPVFAREVLCQLLPLDTERRIEMEAFLALGTLGEADPELRAAYERTDGMIAAACARLVSALTGADEASDRLSLPARHLHALVDGLALHLLRQPAEKSGEWAVEVLDGFLASLTPSGGRSGPEPDAPMPASR